MIGNHLFNRKVQIRLLTANHIKSAPRSERINIDFMAFAQFPVDLLDENFCIAVEHVEKAVQDLKVKGRCEQFAILLPLVACRDRRRVILINCNW